MTEEELAIFDLLTKPDITLSEKEKLEIKKVAKELLSTLKQEKLVLDWRRRQQTKAAVKVAIEEVLDQLPESYSTEVYQRKCQEVYQHVYESYSLGRAQYLHHSSLKRLRSAGVRQGFVLMGSEIRTDSQWLTFQAKG